MKATTPCHQKRFITVLLCILLAALADSNQQGYHWVEEAGQRKLFLNEKQVAWTFGEMIPVKF